jgi:hypothetical protein
VWFVLLNVYNGQTARLVGFYKEEGLLYNPYKYDALLSDQE